MRQDKKTGRTEFTHDGMDVIQDRFEKNDGSTSTTNYVNGIGIDDKLKVTSGTTSRYFLTDHLGSTVGMADTNGSVVESATYDSFGRVQSGNLTTHYGYTGREADEKTGLMYYRARFYDPQIGRFTSEDPIGFAGGDVNLYGYVWNNPQHFKDPLGHQGFYRNPPPGGWKDSDLLITRDPDYHQITISAGTVIGITGSITIDAYGNIYESHGVTIGKSLTGISGSYTQGFLDGRLFTTHDCYYTKEEDIVDHLTGLGINISGGVIFGGGVNIAPFSNHRLSVQGGLYSPQVGISGTVTNLLGNPSRWFTKTFRGN